MRTLLIAALSAVLIGCGGGGAFDSSNISSAYSGLNTSASTESSIPTAVVTRDTSEATNISPERHKKPKKPQPQPQPPQPPATFSVSGGFSIESGIIVDDDVNDIYAQHCSYKRLPSDPRCNNDSIFSPQRLPKLAKVTGFISQRGTQSGYFFLQRFYFNSDPDDYYRVSLEAGQTVHLQLIRYPLRDAQRKIIKADVDLIATRYNNRNQPSGDIYISRGQQMSRAITVEESGDYLLHILAHQGAAKYVLHILPADSDVKATAMANFVPREMIVQSLPQASANAGVTLSTQAQSQSLSLPHKPQPQLIKLPEAIEPQLFSIQVASTETQAYLDKIWTLRAIKQVELSGEVEYAEPNYIRTIQAVPNDEYYHRQWHYPAINLPQAWDITKGLPSEPNTSEVIVAVIDTGVYLRHPDLISKLVPGYDFIANNILSGDGDGIDDDPNDPGDGKTPDDSSWHGTHVAGTIAAATDNNIGVAGVSWGAKIMPIRVLGKEGGTSYDLAQSIRYAAGLSNDSGTLPRKRADIINLSLGSALATETERIAIRDAIESGVLVVAAAGNAGVDYQYYPASYPNVITVSATGYNGTKTGYSNYGSHIDVAAPGGDMSVDMDGDGYRDGVYSTLVRGDSRGGLIPIYSYKQGTSMAAPHVAGVLALMKGLNPALTQYDILNLLSSCEITNKRGKCGHDEDLGYGLIDAYLAVQAARNAEVGRTSAFLQASESKLRLYSQPSVPMTTQITITNHGTAAATNIRVSSSDRWLTAKIDARSARRLPTNDSMPLTITVTPGSLMDGRHDGALTIHYTSGSETKQIKVLVSMLIGSTLIETDPYLSTFTQHTMFVEKMGCDGNICGTPQRVHLLKPVSRIKNGTPYADFQFRVEAGEYRLRVSSDIGGNYGFFSAGETMGEYPTRGRTLKVDRDISGIDIYLLLNRTAQFPISHAEELEVDIAAEEILSIQ